MREAQATSDHRAELLRMNEGARLHRDSEERNQIVKKLIYIALLVPGIAISKEYSLNGAVTAYRAPQEGSHCHIAIKDPSNAYYSNGIHYIANSPLCAVARSAFLLGMEVEATARTNAYGRSDYANDITSITIKRDPKVYWPPYGKG